VRGALFQIPMVHNQRCDEYSFFRRRLKLFQTALHVSYAIIVRREAAEKPLKQLSSGGVEKKRQYTN
jgi:hypothetical protein